MSEEDVRRILATVPGSRRAATGVIIDEGDGMFRHIHGIIVMDPELSEKENLDLAYASRNEIIRVRSLRTAHDYLLRARLEAISTSPRAARTFRQRRARFEERGRRWTLTDYYHAQGTDARRYIARLSRSNRRILKAIPHGLALIDEANAVARKTMLGEVVMVSENLRYFYYFMNLAMYGRYDGVSPIDSIDAALIALRLMRGSESFDFDLDPRAILPGELERRTWTRTAGQMEFTFGHEFAHILEGHMATNQACDDLQLYARECEFAADSCAVLLVGPDVQARKAIARGAFDVLLYLHFLEASANMGLLRGFSGKGTHPRPLERIESLEAALGARYLPPAGEIKESIEAVEAMAGYVRDRVDAWGRPDVLDFYGSLYLSGFTEKMKLDRLEF